MKEEDFIRQQAGKENPFKAPEGYFEDFTARLMQQLPEREATTEPVHAPTSWQKIKPWLYMAAMFIAILLPIRFMMEHTEQETEYTEEYLEYAILDNSGMDDYSFYQYMNAEEDNTSERTFNDEDL